MKIPPPFYPLIAVVVCLLAGSASMPAAAAGEDWKPVDAAELALKSPVVEKEADAEGLFWEVKIDDNPDGNLIFNHYLRVKVFTERGRESQSKIDLPYGKLYGGEVKIEDIAARTIKPDGSIVELNKKDIFERTIVKTSGLKVKAKSFAMPAVEPGCIIEYRWREVRLRTDANYLRSARHPRAARPVPREAFRLPRHELQLDHAARQADTLDQGEERVLQHRHD